MSATQPRKLRGRSSRQNASTGGKSVPRGNGSGHGTSSGCAWRRALKRASSRAAGGRKVGTFLGVSVEVDTGFISVPSPLRPHSPDGGEGLSSAIIVYAPIQTLSDDNASGMRL